MSNGLLSKKLKATIANNTLSNPGYVQVRCKTGRKFLVPDSFKPHLLKKKNVWAPSKGEVYGHKWRGNGRTPQEEVETPSASHVQNTLVNTIETSVVNAAGQELGLATEPVLKAFCGQSHHPHIASFMKGYVSVTTADRNVVKLYWMAIMNYLPDDPLTKSHIMTARGKLNHRTYTWASPRSIPASDGIKATSNRMNLGWHMFLYTNPIIGNRLLFDGTDARFIPGPSSAWPHRLWAGGSINLHRMFPGNLEWPAVHHLVEKPINLRIVGVDQTPEKVFVTVRKEFHAIEGKIRPDDYNLNGVMQTLKERPAYNNNAVQIRGPWLEETYTLCFLRNAPNLSSAGAVTKVIAPPPQPKFSYTFTPDRHLLFCWSALSYNAHLIHLDTAFAQKEYGAKDLIVHGPLTLILTLEWFHREITKYAIERQLSRFHVQSIDYKNLAPLYINEPMTICTKPTKFQTPGTLADSWEVWVQKDLGGGLKSMAFKGTIKLRVEQEPVSNTGHKSLKLQESVLADTPSSEDVDASEFKSPFF